MRVSPSAATAFEPPPAHLERHRLTLDDGAATTLHLARYPLADWRPRVVRLRRPAPLEHWCARNGIAEAVVGGFFVRPDGTPLGEVRTRGMLRRHVPFAAPFAERRACLHVSRDGVAIGARDSLSPGPGGDLLQAGPLLVAGRAAVCVDDTDTEGFSAASHQFDSDITAGRHPRAAIALAGSTLLTAACDGRADDEAGLTLGELAATLVALGADAALNLDGGGSTSLICGGALRNVAREQHGLTLPGGRPVSTAVALQPRG